MLYALLEVPHGLGDGEGAWGRPDKREAQQIGVFNTAEVC